MSVVNCSRVVLVLSREEIFVDVGKNRDSMTFAAWQSSEIGR